MIFPCLMLLSALGGPLTSVVNQAGVSRQPPTIVGARSATGCGEGLNLQSNSAMTGMRNVLWEQSRLSSSGIEAIKRNANSRDEIPVTLIGLQLIDKHKATRAEPFRIIVRYRKLASNRPSTTLIYSKPTPRFRE